MSGNSNLERDIGELSGIMQSLGPALERLEARMNAAEKAAAANDVEVAHMVKQFVAFRDQSIKVIEEFKRKTANEAGRQAQTAARAAGDIKTLQDAVALIEGRRAGVWTKVWEVAKLLIAAGLGVVGARWFK